MTERREKEERELARLERAGEEAVDVDLDALFRGVATRIEEARGPRYWLRSRSTLARRALAVAMVAAVAGFVFATMPRPDLGVYPLARMLASLLAMGTLLVICVHYALRPLHEPELGRGRTWLLVSLALGTALLVGALPPAHQAHPASLSGTGDHLLSSALPCFTLGAAVALPLYGLDRLLDRGSGGSALLAAGSAGVACNFVLHLRCPIVAPEHILLAHFSVAAILVAVVAAAGVAPRRSRRRGAS